MNLEIEQLRVREYRIPKNRQIANLEYNKNFIFTMLVL
jgi:hypothetical protein